MKRFLSLWKYISSYKLKLAASLAALAFVSLTSLVYPWLLKLMVDKFSGNSSTDVSMTTLTVLLVIVFLLSTILGYYTFVQMQELGIILRNNLRSAFYEKLLFLPLSFYKDRQIGELSSRATEDISKVQPVFTSLVSPAFQNILFILGCIILMLLLNITATIIVVALTLLPLPFLVLYSRKIRKLTTKSQAEHAGANALMQETLVGIKEIKSFVLEKLKLTRYKERLDKASINELEASKYHSKITQTVYLILSVILLGIFFAGTSKTFSPGWSIGSVIAFYFYAYTMTMAFLAAGRVYLFYQGIAGAADRIQEILEQNITSPGKEIILKSSDFTGKIEFKDVSFSYEENKPVLSHLSFNCDAGDWLLITGASGSGKSTIANMIAGLYEPQEGIICVDDIPMKNIDIYGFRKDLGYVTQDPVLFQASIRENIDLTHRPISEERLNKVLKICCLDEFITDLPEGLNTIIGERGITVSGGQKARIAIARAIVTDPTLLILDEANSMLEPELEKELWENLLKERTGKTSIILSHHFENIPKVYKRLDLNSLNELEDSSEISALKH